MKDRFVPVASRREVLRFGAISSLGLALPGRVLSGSDTSVDKAAGAALPHAVGPLHSAGALTFGADNVLFVADISGALKCQAKFLLA